MRLIDLYRCYKVFTGENAEDTNRYQGWVDYNPVLLILFRRLEPESAYTHID